MDANEYAARARQRQESGDLDGAMSDIREALRLDRRHAEAFHVRAHTDAIRIRPDSAHAYHSRANVCRALGDLDGAVADWTASLAREPANAAVVQKRGSALLSLRRIDEAYRDFSQALELDPKNAE